MEEDKFDNFKWLLSNKLVQENILPEEDSISYNNGQFGCNLKAYYFVVHFYALYVQQFGLHFIEGKIKHLKNDTAKRWADFAIKKIPDVTKHINDEFIGELEDLVYRLKILDTKTEEIFKPFMPFITLGDYCRFAIENLESPLYHYFYILIILWYENDFPDDATKIWKYKYKTCPKRTLCKKAELCSSCKQCYYLESTYGKDYNFAEELNDFQKELTLDFLNCVPTNLKEKFLVKFYESIQQINNTGLFDAKLSLSYDKVLYGNNKPLNGDFYLRWDKVMFFNGYYIVSHPSVPFNQTSHCRVEDENSRKAFNDINGLFLKKLPPLHVQAKNGNIVKVLNRANLESCISVMEHKVTAPSSSKKTDTLRPKFTKREFTANAAKTFCKEIKSKFLNYLCAKQLEHYNVICLIEHKVNSAGTTSCEYSFIFTIKENYNRLYLAYENATNSRCTYILPISKRHWQESIDKIYNFFASNEVNKRQQMASRLINLELPGNYE